METKLLPCPWCEQAAHKIDDEDVCCIGDDAGKECRMAGIVFTYQEWNDLPRRAPSDREARFEKALREIVAGKHEPSPLTVCPSWHIAHTALRDPDHIALESPSPNPEGK